MPIGQLSELQRQAGDYLQNAKRLKDWIDSAINLKYQNQTTNLRHAQDRPTGTINFEDGGFKVSSIIAKKVEWDQFKLKEAISQIKEMGDNPYEYVNVSYKVSETKYNAWPEYIKKFFRSARVLKAGKESFKIEVIKSGAGSAFEEIASKSAEVDHVKLSTNY
jgi:hypothetical protein